MDGLRPLGRGSEWNTSAARAEVVGREKPTEIDLYRRHGDAFGYVFYLLRRAAG